MQEEAKEPQAQEQPKAEEPAIETPPPTPTVEETPPTPEPAPTPEPTKEPPAQEQPVEPTLPPAPAPEPIIETPTPPPQPTPEPPQPEEPVENPTPVKDEPVAEEPKLETTPPVAPTPPPIAETPPPTPPLAPAVHDPKYTKDIPQKVLELTAEEINAARLLWARENIGQAQKQANRNRTARMNQRMNEIEKIVKEKPQTNVRFISNTVQLSQKLTSSYLQRLVKAGRIKATGNTANRRFYK